VSDRYIWIGITIGVFFAGIGIGYLVYTNTYNNPVTMMQNQQFQQNWMGPWMMNDINWHDMMSSGMMSNIQK
jgi:hypothetical protein